MFEIRVIVLGGTGCVGFHLVRDLSKKHEVQTVSKSSQSATRQIDLVSDFQSFAALVAEFSPDVVANAVKPQLSTDAMEEKREIAYAVNTALPGNICDLQKKHGFLYVHMSTDWVYEGKNGVIYDENSPVQSMNYYTKTKLDAEEIIRKKAERHLIIRTEGVFGIDRRKSNLFMRMRNTAEKTLTFPADQYAQPIYAGELASAIGKLLEKGCSGIYNVLGNDYLSRYELADAINGHFKLGLEIKKGTCIGRGIKIPQYLRVSTEKYEKECGRIAPIKKQLGELEVLENELEQNKN